MPSVPPHQDFKHKVKAKAYRAVERAGLVWVYMGVARRGAAAAGFEVLDAARRTRSTSASSSATATGCRRSRARSTPRISASCTRGHVDPEDAAGGRAVLPHGHQPRAASTTWPRRRGARSMPATARPGPARPTGASPTSCFRSGRRRPTASSAATCMRAPGCRSTTSTRCSCFIWWKQRQVGACRCRSPAFKDGTPIGGTGRGGNKMLPNTTDWLGRWRLADDEDNDWGMDRDSAAQQRDLQRHRRHPPAGPGDHREHGPDHRPRPRAPGAVRPDDHAHAPSPAAGGARAARQGRLPPGADDPEVYRGARSGYFLAPDDGAPGRRSMPGRWPLRSILPDGLTRAVTP